MDEILFDNIKDEWFDYKNDDMIIIKDITKIPVGIVDDCIKTNFIAILFCGEGKLQMDIDGVGNVLCANEAMIFAMNSVMTNLMMSPDLHVFAIGIAPSFIEKNMLTNTKLWKYAEYIKMHHIIQLTKKDIDLFEAYYKIGVNCLDRTDSLIKKHIIFHLQHSFIYEIIDLVDRNMPVECDESNSTRQGDILFRKFISLLVEKDGTMHKVSDYADLLHVTPKYLSITVKNASGSSALHCIQEYMVKMIKEKLTYSDMSIKEISIQMNFPSISSFGKFVRKHLEISPKFFRQNVENGKEGIIVKKKVLHP